MNVLTIVHLAYYIIGFGENAFVEMRSFVSFFFGGIFKYELMNECISFK